MQDLYQHNIDPQKVVHGSSYHFIYLIKGASIEKNRIIAYVPKKKKMIAIDFDGNLIREIPIFFDDQGDQLYALKRIYNDYVDNKYYFIAFTDGAIEIYEER
jgi:hypothetical protein